MAAVLPFHRSPDGDHGNGRTAMEAGEIEALLAENRLLREEIRVAREAADITAELVVKQFEETERILHRFQTTNALRRAVLNSASQISIIATDIDGTITVMNTGAENLLGYRADEMVGRQTPEIFHSETELVARGRRLSEERGRPVQPARLLLEYALTGRSEQEEWIYVTREGRWFPVNMTINALRDPDGTVNGILCIAMDITERKHAEEALRRAHDELERRVTERTEALAQANAELQVEIRERKQVEEALRENEQQLAGIMDSITDRMSIIDEDFTIVWANDIARRMFGQDIIGRKCHEAYRGFDAVCTRCIAAKTFKDGKIHEHENDAIDLDGERIIFWCTTSVTAWHKDGRPRLVVENSRNITARKRAEEALRDSEEKFRSIFENATEGIFQTTPAGRFLMVNPAFVRIMGYRSEAELIETVTDVQHQIYVNPRRRDEFQELMETQGSAKNFETRFHRRDGSIIHVSLNAHVVKDEEGKIRYYEGILEDTTQRKRAEDLKIAKDAAEAATQAKSGFLANMSHEIRTPLNAVIGLTELVMKTQMTPKQLDYVEKISTSSHSLLGIINDILDFSKIEAGRLQLESVQFDLMALLEKLTDMFAGKAAEKGIEMIVSVSDDVPRDLMGDPLRLGQVLTNLTANSVKFTDEGEVVVQVTRLRQDNGAVRLRFTIRDTGIGIDRANLPHLFSAFTQADGSTTRRYGGTGLGLTICKRLVEMMDGEIHATSEPGRGSTFHFTVQLEVQPGAPRRRRTIPDSLLGKTVLVVDDNATSRKILSESLQGYGLKTETAETAADALANLKHRAEPVDLVVMDWMMPGMDGIEALRQMKSDPELARLPVILMTAFGREEVVSQAEAVGVDAFLIKPIKQSVLYDVMMNVFGETVECIDQMATSSEPLAGLHGARVLLVEDNLINRQVASEILACAGIEVDQATDGREAVDLVERKLYDAVLMDVQMPGMDGYQATHHIRKILELTELPIIAMTAHAMKGDREKCIQAGMDDYITKPINTEMLYTLLSRYVTRSAPGPAQQRPAGRGIPARAPRTASSFPSLPGIDVAGGLARIGHNEKLFAELIETFARKYAGFSKELRDAIRSSEARSALPDIHALKGVASNISAETVAEAAGNLESAIRKGETELDLLLNALEAAIDQVIRSADTLSKALPTTDEPPLEKEGRGVGEEAPEAPGRLIRKLDRMLRDHDLDAEDQLAEILPMIPQSGAPGSLSQKLAEAVRELRFEPARKSLKRLARELEVRLDEPS